MRWLASLGMMAGIDVKAVAPPAPIPRTGHVGWTTPSGEHLSTTTKPVLYIGGERVGEIDSYTAEYS